MEEGLIGVIVPVYKVEKYIAECIESILAQTYTNFRLILVDDGTPDNAGKICDEYAEKDSRITVIHQENAGVTRARAQGVEEASDCEFITFVDSDDMLAKTALFELHKKIDDYTDIVMCTCYYTEEKSCIAIGSHKNIEKLDINDYIKKLICLDGGMPWGKLFRRNLFNQATFDTPKEVVYGEDALMNIRLAFESGRNIKTIYKPLYFYRQHNESICSIFEHTFDYEKTLEIQFAQVIPENRKEEYIHELIWRRIKFCRLTGSNNMTKPIWSNTDYHKRLKADIMNTKIELPHFERALIFHTNTIIRAIIIFCRKTYNFITKTPLYLNSRTR